MLDRFCMAFVVLIGILCLAACTESGEVQENCGANRDCPPSATSTRRMQTSLPTVDPTPEATDQRACEPPYPSGPRTTITVFCADPATMEAASVVRIVDGDTLRALVDGVEEPIRLFGVDTPERGEQCFDDATDALRAIVAINGGQVLLVRDARNHDTYDRLLRYVYTPAGLSIDALLVSGGYGYAWTRDGALRDPLVELEDNARTESRGCLWR